MGSAGSGAHSLLQNGGEPSSLSAYPSSSLELLDSSLGTRNSLINVSGDMELPAGPTLVSHEQSLSHEQTSSMTENTHAENITPQEPSEVQMALTSPIDASTLMTDKNFDMSEESKADQDLNTGRAYYNPSQLLNPKGKPSAHSGNHQTPTKQASVQYASTATNPGPIFQFSTTTEADDSDSEGDQVGMGSLIERSHALHDREASPAKRLKLDPDPNSPHKKAQAFFGEVKTGGLISEHIKQKPKGSIEASQEDVITIDDEDESGPNANGKSLSDTEVVDLTADESKNGNKNLADPDQAVVCFGKLDGAKVSMHTLPEHKDHKGWTVDQKQWKALPVTLWRMPNNGNFVIHVRDYHNKIFGTIDLRVARALAPLMDSKNVFPGFRIDARLDPHIRTPNSHFGDPVSDQWPISLNVYGPKKHAQAIANELRKKNVWLGAPTGLVYGTEVFNPHAAERAAQGRMRPSKFAPGRGGYVTRTNEQIEKDINSVFDRVKNHEDLKAGIPAPCVLTPLLAHQLQCLTFMHDREGSYDDRPGHHSSSLWRSRVTSTGKRSYYNVITGNEELDPPPPVRGGILADQMGLGKTLETLAHFASTLEEARELDSLEATSNTASGKLVQDVGTTLLICPKNVMSNWEEQIAAHLQEDSVSYYLYYGSNRVQDLESLRKYDLVITTYSIISSELNRRENSVLKAAKWFRIILDEGHMIREQSTLQSKAVCDLEAERRWVLTGTPVQNKLEDLGALLKFLRVKPFDQASNFNQYIIAPLKLGNVDGVKRLRTLVDVITLRRLKDRVNILPRTDETIKLEFSADEKKLYNWIKNDAKSRVRKMDDSAKRGGRQMGGILRLISCLRMISDHGKELVRTDELPDTRGISTTDPLVIDGEDEETIMPPLTAFSAYEMLHLVRENDANYCIKCSKKVAPSEDEDDPDKMFGVMLRCYDLVCADCAKRFTKDLEKNAVNGRCKCPMCGAISDLTFFDLTQNGIDQAEAERQNAKLNPTKAKRLCEYEKPHTKTLALLHELYNIELDNAKYQHSPPVKSIVFTEWTSHIDLLEIALQNHLSHTKYVRLDGSMSRKQQTKAMNSLRNDDSITLMLISIRAGGVGINLTSASRVFVMEPHWNPAAEAQAIDRVHRLGQTREVKVTRFVMADSIEEQIVKRQTMKMDLADMSMNRKVDNIKAKMDRFKELFR